jgi:hypothetical protein
MLNESFCHGRSVPHPSVIGRSKQGKNEAKQVSSSFFFAQVSLSQEEGVCVGVACADAGKILPGIPLKVRNDEAKDTAGFKDAPGVFERGVKVIERKML